MDSNLDKFQTQWLHTDTSNQAADSKWIDIISCRAPFAAQHFKAALELMLNEPNITSSQILRAEIISDTSTQQGNRCLVRNLVPKQPEKDVVVVQRVLLSPIQTHGSQTSMHTEYQALSQYSLDSATPASPSQLPYFYPKVAKFKYSYIGDSCLETGHVVISVLPFETMESLAVDPRYLRIWERLVKFIHRFGRGMRDGYQKRVHHDQVVDKKTYQDLYYILKNKYKEWVLKWPEETDPSKHVFEDIGIATWLILLWKSTGEKNVRFVDVGCGNGFLTYLLTAEGYNGYGIDMSKRKIWNLFGDCDLQERPIIPNKEVFDCNWVIGNHPDELTLWIPIMALRSNASFVIIPGARFTEHNQDIGRYMTYVQHVEAFCKSAGYDTQREHLRIPSTKNICIIGQADERGGSGQANIEDIVNGVTFVLRKTDAQRTAEYLKNRRAKLGEQAVASGR